MKNPRKSKSLPASFRPLLWSLKWGRLSIEKDKEDIILNTINDGTLEQWRWLRDTYGRNTIRKVLQRRLASEFHPESRNLARVVFDVTTFPYARRSARAARTKNISAPRTI